MIMIGEADEDAHPPSDLQHQAHGDGGHHGSIRSGEEYHAGHLGPTRALQPGKETNGIVIQ